MQCFVAKDLREYLISLKKKTLHLTKIFFLLKIQILSNNSRPIITSYGSVLLPLKYKKSI
jgi:hypothetical protein